MLRPDIAWAFTSAVFAAQMAMAVMAKPKTRSIDFIRKSLGNEWIRS